MLSTLFPAGLRAPGLDRLSRELNQFFETVPIFTQTVTLWPAMNIWRGKDSLVVEAEIPGFKHQDLDILATHDSLTIRGERSPAAPEGATPLHLERRAVQFERAVNLPVPINANGITATLINGVLRVTLPVAETARPRRVQLTDGQSPLAAETIERKPAA